MDNCEIFCFELILFIFFRYIPARTFPSLAAARPRDPPRQCGAERRKGLEAAAAAGEAGRCSCVAVHDPICECDGPHALESINVSPCDPSRRAGGVACSSQLGGYRKDSSTFGFLGLGRTTNDVSSFKSFVPVFVLFTRPDGRGVKSTPSRRSTDRLAIRLRIIDLHLHPGVFGRGDTHAVGSIRIRKATRGAWSSSARAAPHSNRHLYVPERPARPSCGMRRFPALRRGGFGSEKARDR